MLGIFSEHGIRFDYPPDWDLDVVEDEGRVTVSVQDAGGTAFAMIVLDEDRPLPAEVLEEAAAAMREEYPNLDAQEATETIAGQKALGLDIEFFSLDLLGTCVLRSVRTPARTILVMCQWSDSIDGEHQEALFRAIRTSLVETSERESES